MDMGNLDAEQWYPDAAPHQQPPLAGELTSSYDDSSSLYSDEVGLGGDYGVTASVTQPMKLDDDSFFRLVLDGVIVPILYGLITIVGAAGNMLVIYVIVAKPRMRTVTNLLLLSLACADLAFVLVVPPFTAYQNATSNWPFGDVACRLMHYMVNVAAYVTVYTLVVIAGLRYATVVHGVRTARYRTKRNATAAAATIWAVVLAVNVPILMSYHVVEITGCLVCDINEAQIGQRIFATFFALCYVLPLSVIAIFSLCIVRHLANVEKTSSLGAARRAAAGGGPGSSSNGTGHRGVDKKRHAGRLLVLVVVLFALLWLPVHVYLLVSYFYGEIKHPAFQVAAVAFTCLAYFNSCVNPFIYNHASKEFREAFIEVARCGRVSSTSATSTAKTATCDPNAKTVMASSLTAKTANRTSTLAVDDCKSMTKQNGGGADEVGDSMTRLLSVGNNAVESGEGRSAGVVGAESKNGCGGCADGN